MWCCYKALWSLNAVEMREIPAGLFSLRQGPSYCASSLISVTFTEVSLCNLWSSADLLDLLMLIWSCSNYQTLPSVFTVIKMCTWHCFSLLPVWILFEEQVSKLKHLVPRILNKQLINLFSVAQAWKKSPKISSFMN